MGREAPHLAGVPPTAAAINSVSHMADIVPPKDSPKWTCSSIPPGKTDIPCASIVSVIALHLRIQTAFRRAAHSPLPTAAGAARGGHQRCLQRAVIVQRCGRKLT